MKSRRALAVCLLCFGVGLLAGACDRRPDVVVLPPKPLNVEAELSYDLVRTLDSGMEQLNGLAVGAGGRLYLAGSDGVRVLDERGGQVLAFATDGAAQCIAVDDEGSIYVGLLRKVLVYDADGAQVNSWGREGDGPGELSYVTGISVSGANVYVADAGNRRVHRFDTTGDFISDIGEPDPENNLPGIICPSPHLDCVEDADGLLHVNNPGRLRVDRYRADGSLVGWWGQFGIEPEEFCGCCNPTDIALMADGRMVTAEKGVPRVKVYDRSGKMLAYIGHEHFSPNPDGLDVAVDGQGRIYVADPGDGKVRVFALSQ